MKRTARILLSLLLVFCLSFSFVSCAIPEDIFSELPEGIFPDAPESSEDPPAQNPQAPTPTEGELSVHFLDVGQADAILILDGDKTMMIDTGDWPNGEDKAYMLSYIESLGITVIDYLVLTHPDADHIGGAPEVINTFDVKNCIMPNATKTSAVFERTIKALEDNEVNVILPVPGDDYTLKNASFRILAPINEKYKDSNDYSVVLRMQYGEKSILFTGDAETLSESEMLEKYTAADLKADVLKVGHHGSSTSSTQTFLDLVDPDYAVISCGVGNSYGHPHSAVIDRLNARELALFRTDTQGTIVLKTDGKELSLEALGKRDEDAAAAYTVEYLYFNRKLSAIIAINSLFVGFPREL